MKKTDATIRKIHTLVATVLKERNVERKKENMHKVQVGWPVFNEKEVNGALDALLELRISQGPRVKEFESLCARYVGTKYAVAVNSGSSANLVALGALMQSGKVQRGDEVILPATTFATVASPVLQLGLIPVYVDIDDTWNLDPHEVEKAISPRTRVIMAVHTFGNPADMTSLSRIAQKHNLVLFEDCCEAHGAAIGKKKVGSMSDIATLSFFVAHNITTGEGGMVFTNDNALYEILLSMREFGRFTKPIGRFEHKDEVLGVYDTRYVFTRLGYNIRMTDVEAALGIAQIKKLDALNKRRVANVRAYEKEFTRHEKYLSRTHIEKGNFHSYYGFPFCIKKGAPFTRMDLVQHLETNGIETRPFFGGSLPDQPAFRNEPKRVVGTLPYARHVRDNGIFIGCHSELSPAQIRHVRETLRSFFRAKGLQ